MVNLKKSALEFDDGFTATKFRGDFPSFTDVWHTPAKCQTFPVVGVLPYVLLQCINLQ